MFDSNFNLNGGVEASNRNSHVQIRLGTHKKTCIFLGSGNNIVLLRIITRSILNCFRSYFQPKLAERFFFVVFVAFILTTVLVGRLTRVSFYCFDETERSTNEDIKEFRFVELDSRGAEGWRA